MRNESGSADFMPTDLSGLSLWFDASDLSTITKDASNKVSQWNDKSGNANHCTQSTSAAQPTYSATGLNSLPAMTQTGSQYFALTTNLTVSNATCFFVANLNSKVNQGFFGRNVGVGVAAGAFALFGATPTMSFFDQGSDESDWNLSISTGTSYIFSCITNNSAPAATGYLSGVLKTLTGSSGGAFSMEMGLVGSRRTDIYLLNGAYSEAILYQANLSTANHTRVITYLKNKWGIA